MPNTKETTRDQAEWRTGDLRGQYRPIGIGAVAAALSATHMQKQTEPNGAANSNERNSEHESLAA